MNYMIHMMNEEGEDIFIFSKTEENPNIKDCEEAGFHVEGIWKIELKTGKDNLPEISEPGQDEPSDEPDEAQFEEIKGEDEGSGK